MRGAPLHASGGFCGLPADAFDPMLPLAPAMAKPASGRPASQHISFVTLGAAKHLCISMRVAFPTMAGRSAWTPRA